MRPTLRLTNTAWMHLSGRNTDEAVIRLLLDYRLHEEVQEVAVVIPIRPDLRTPGPVEVGRGTYGSVDFPIPVALGAVLAAGCDRFAIAHNHPIEDPEMSDRDRALVTRFREAGRTVGLTFEASYVVTPSGAWSMLAGDGIACRVSAAAPRKEGWFR